MKMLQRALECHRVVMARAIHCAVPCVMPDLPEEMFAAHIRIVGSGGGPEALEVCQVPVPLPKPGEILIKVEAAGVNRPDVLQRQGVYPPPAGHSQIPGLEVSGTIAAIGPGVAVEGCLFDTVIGTRVCALTNGGGYAQFCAVPHTQVLPVPHFARDYDVERGDYGGASNMLAAACVPETLFTVWHNMVQQCNIFGEKTFDIEFLTSRARAGSGGSNCRSTGSDRAILIHGGSSGIGTTAIQLARAFGATVFATAGSGSKCALVESLGATAINYKESDFAQHVENLTCGHGIDLILDMVGGSSYLDRNCSVLKPGGRLAIIGSLGGADAEINIRPVMRKRLTVGGSTIRARSAMTKARIAAEVHAACWHLFECGAMHVILDHCLKERRFSLDDVSAAHWMMENSKIMGKIGLTIDH